jgi:hypothetical protein
MSADAIQSMHQEPMSVWSIRQRVARGPIRLERRTSVIIVVTPRHTRGFFGSLLDELK